jgi:hypothetical protein
MRGQLQFFRRTFNALLNLHGITTKVHVILFRANIIVTAAASARVQARRDSIDGQNFQRIRRPVRTCT